MPSVMAIITLVLGIVSVVAFLSPFALLLPSLTIPLGLIAFRPVSPSLRRDDGPRDGDRRDLAEPERLFRRPLPITFPAACGSSEKHVSTWSNGWMPCTNGI